MTVIDVSEQDFQQQVIDKSAEVPVVVDFWAEWCGPCRQLGPLLEREAAAREGQVVLAKVDTDANPGISQSFGIQGIPAVKAFRDGKVVSEFVGAQPPPKVKQFFDALVPSEADALVESGDEESLRRAIELEPARADARVKLAGLLHRRGESDQALELLENVAGDFAGEGLAARIGLEQDPIEGTEEAWRAYDEGDLEKATDLLISAIPHSDGRTDELRRALVGIFDELGVEHPAAREGRRRLAAALY
jgi:putative thioredoxin